MNYSGYIPKSESDYKTVEKLWKLTDEEIEPLLYYLYDWILDPNWIVAGELRPLLLQKQNISIDAVRRLFHEDEFNEELKYEVLCRVACWNRDNIEKVLPSIERMAYSPMLYEKRNDLSKTAEKFIKSFREEDYGIDYYGNRTLDCYVDDSELESHYTQEMSDAIKAEYAGFESLKERVNSWLKEAFSGIKEVEKVTFGTHPTIMAHCPEKKSVPDVINTAFESTLSIKSVSKDPSVIESVLKKLAELSLMPKCLSFNVNSLEDKSESEECFYLMLDEEIRQRVNEKMSEQA